MPRIGVKFNDSDAIHDNVAAEISAVTEKVTPVNADLMLVEDSADSNNKKRVQLNNLPGVGTDNEAIHDNVAAEISAVTEKVTPVNADLILIEDSADSNNKKRAQLNNLPGVGTDNEAIHDNVAAEISAITEKVTPVSADLLLLEDSADSNNKKRVQVGNLPAGGGAITPLYRDLSTQTYDGLGADLMMSYTLPANSLSANDMAVRAQVWGEVVNTLGTKYIWLYFGSSIVVRLDHLASTFSNWWIDAYIYRTGTGAQKFLISYGDGANILGAGIWTKTLAKDETAALDIEVFVQLNYTSIPSCIVVHGLTVDLMAAP